MKVESARFEGYSGLSWFLDSYNGGYCQILYVWNQVDGILLCLVKYEDGSTTKVKRNWLLKTERLPRKP